MNKTRLKRHIALLLAVIMCMTFSSCSKNEDANAKNEADQEIHFAEDLPLLIDVADEEVLINGKSFRNNYKGYEIVIPTDARVDDSLGLYATKITGHGYDITISKEKSPYAEMTAEMRNGLKNYGIDYEALDATEQYILYYESRFLLNKDWQKNNDVDVTAVERLNFNGYEALVFSATINGVLNENYDAFTYAYIKLGGRDYLRVLVRCRKESTAFRSNVLRLFDDIQIFDPTEKKSLNVLYGPKLPEAWSSDTIKLYNDIKNSNALRWGIYSADMFKTGINETIPGLEEKLEFTFPVVLTYSHSIHKFPTEFMEQTANDGRIVELTYQLTDTNNENMLAKSVMLDLYRGIEIPSIAEFAKGASEFGKPFLFRLCNEMNSDWTNYSGVVNMADPDVFIAAWREIYKIFEKEGVNNCIWIFNPNDRNCPPTNWNNALRYYPGDEYVQMIGVTGYNNGNYYKNLGEHWREFKTIYDEIERSYGQVFGCYPWIITEFASSSYGGNKKAWIDSMFDHIDEYPRIKIAVWFNAADYDSKGKAARPYWLDETKESLNAFKKGLSAYK